MPDRKVPLQNVIDSALAGTVKDIYTSVPGHIITFNPTTQRAQVQIGIQRVQIDGITFDPPPIVDVPVSFPGDDYILEYQINPGCEGDVHFSQRCIDGWKQTGGIADNPVARFHHPQDAKFIPGIRSLANAISNFANNGVRLRDKSGNRHIWIKNDNTLVIKNGTSSTTYGADNSVSTSNGNGYINLLANGIVNINGVTFSPTGRVTLPGGGGLTLANGVQAEAHRHGGVQTGGGTSGGPTN